MKNALLATAGTVALLMPVSAMAQVDEIVVTATKREQTLQEVPVAVSVVQEDTIQNAQIIDVFDLQTVVPSLQIGQNQSSQNTTFTIRGFGNGGNNVGIEPSVAVFIDGVYRSRSAGAISDLTEIERVEVLRGPQSTLFGKNASAGVVSVVTKSPQFETEGKVELTYGNYDQRLVRGYVTGPLSETLAYSLEGTFNQRDGFVENELDGPDFNDRDRWSLRGQLLAEPTDASKFRLIVDYDELDEVCCFAGNALAGPTLPIIQALGGNVRANDIFAREAFQDITPTNKIVNSGVSLQADFDLGDAATLTSITSYRDRNVNENIDADFTSLPAIGANPQVIDFETFTQELRVSGETDRLGWLVGGFYSSEDVVADSYIAYGPAFRPYGTLLALAGAGAPLTPAIIGGVAAGSDLGGLNPLTSLEDALGLPRGIFFAENQTFETEFDQDNTSLTLFAQGDFDVTDKLTLTAGIAYNYDKKNVSLESFNTDVFSSLNFVEIGFGGTFNAVTGLEPTPENIGAFAAANPAAFADLQRGSTFTDEQALEAGAILIDPSTGAPTTDAAVGVLVFPATGIPASNRLLGLTALQFLPPQVAFGNPDVDNNLIEDGETKDDDFTFTLRAAYDVTDRLNVYGSWATGFKASSWNLTRDSRPLPADAAALAADGLLPNTTSVPLGGYQGTRFAGPEETEVFELGAKARFDWGSVNVAIFDQSIDGFQSTIFQGTGFVLANAGKQSVRGAEVEVFASPTDRLDVSFAATILDSEFDEFPGAAGPDGPFDASGLSDPGVPEFSSSASFTYTQPLSMGAAFVRADWQYESERDQIVLNVPEGVVEREISSINASIGLNMDNGFEALLFARNLFDNEYPIQAFPSVAQAGSFSAYPNAPRTYGLTVRKRF